MDYRIIKKSLSEFQKLLNQWKRLFEVEIIKVFYSNTEQKFIAIIKRLDKCPHGTFGGLKHCTKCKGDSIG